MPSFYEIHGLPIKQFVIYLGEGNWTALTHIKSEQLHFTYNVICLNTIDYEVFLAGEKPEEINIDDISRLQKRIERTDYTTDYNLFNKQRKE